MKRDKNTLKNSIRAILENIVSGFNSKNSIDIGKLSKIFSGENYTETRDKEDKM